MKTLSRISPTRGTIPPWPRAIGLFALLALTAHGEFTPGSGGSVPDIAPLTGIANQIPGLSIEKSDRHNNVFFSGTYAEVDMDFPPPSTHGASGYQLQRSPVASSTWTNFLATSTNSQDNFSFSLDSTYKYRLLVQGGTKSGYLSNVVTATPSSVDTRFSQWGLDESMFISGTMLPWVGRGLTASFSVNKLSDESVVSGGLSYQWYRVNPQSWAMTAIPGATGLTYITTEDDLGGYRLMCRATGNDTTVGGHVQVISSSGILVPNNSYYSGLTANGFYLNLHKSVPSLEPAELKLTYWEDSTEKAVSITNVTAAQGNATFWIDANIPTSAPSLTLNTISDIWSLGSEMGPGHFMQSLQITVPTEGFAPEIDVEHPAGTSLTDGTGTRSMGKVLIGKAAPASTFTIRNTGTANLTGLGISKNGTHSADFLVSGLASTSIVPGGSATFKVTFKPTAAGTRTAAIHIASNDANENTFDINLTGNAIAPAPEIVVQEPRGTSLKDDASSRNFGITAVNTVGKSKAFTIKNTGTAVLKELDVRLGGAHANDFILLKPTVIKLLPGTSTTFRVTFKPKSKGISKASLKIFSNDADEDPFDIVLTGTGS